MQIYFFNVIFFFKFMARKENSLFQKLLISNSNMFTKKSLEYVSILLVNQPFLFITFFIYNFLNVF